MTKKVNKPKRKGRLLKISLEVAAIFVAFVITATLLSFLWFLSLIPRDAGISEFKKVNSIIVLTGGSNRIDSGMLLLKRGLADNLFVSGVERGITINKMLRASGFSDAEIMEMDDVREKIFIGYEADDTKSNAKEVKAWLEKRKKDSIYLVTANYHMPRSLLIFTENLPQTEIIPYPVFPENFHINGWLMHGKSREIVIGEYMKYMNTMFKMYF